MNGLFEITLSDVQGCASAATPTDGLVQQCHGWQRAASAMDGKELRFGFSNGLSSPSYGRIAVLPLPVILALYLFISSK
ncbi:MAG: hypothetical protein CVU90_11735 [Firmicutes bacterium HGW-Firmicutes-15]|nr:MAG: hypothetical protein CVU90_11735 [Firmicutes bacterium HGW-Firmicutes-15]